MWSIQRRQFCPTWAVRRAEKLSGRLRRHSSTQGANVDPKSLSGLRVDATEQQRIEEELGAGPPCLIRSRCAVGSAFDCPCFMDALRRVRQSPTVVDHDLRRFSQGKAGPPR